MKQSCRMLHQPDRLTLQSPLRVLSVLVFLLLLTPCCRGESMLIGPPQSIVAAVGDDVILPCHLEPVMDMTSVTLEWKRSDLNPKYVHVMRSGQNLEKTKNPSYKGRTSLFTDELKRGNISLKLSKVQLSDQGTYECYIPDLDKQSSVKLVVVLGSASYPVISLAGIDKSTSGVLLECKSKGWYPEPEVLWLDGEGNLLSAGPPETVRGPDDLYTVSSRVTVEKRHSNSFTCRVQQKNTNQTREAHVSISNDFFKLQSSSVPVITGLAVGLAVCIVFILFVVWKWRLNRIKTQRNHLDQTDKGEKKNCSETDKSEDQSDTEEREREREQLMTHETVEMEFKKKRSEQQLQEEKRREEEEKRREEEEKRMEEEEKRREEEEKRREEQKKEVETLKEELQIKKIEIETKGAELQQLHEEKKRNEDELQSQKEELEEKNKELENIIINRSSSTFHSSLKGNQTDVHSQLLEETQRRKDAQREVEKLKNELESQKKEMKDKQQATEAQLKKTNDELNRQLKSKKEENSQLKSDFNKQICDEQQKKEGAQGDLKQLMTKNTEWKQKFYDETTKRVEAEKEVEKLKKEVETKMKDKQAADAQMKKTNEDLKEAESQLKIKDEENNKMKGEFEKQLCDDLQQKKEEAERELEELIKNTEIEKKPQEETTKREEAEKEEENPKKEIETKANLENSQQEDEPMSASDEP